VADYPLSPRLDSPATAEKILMSVEELKTRHAKQHGQQRNLSEVAA